MNEVTRRPFYTEYAWAFDLLIDRPVRRECAVIAEWLVDRGVLPGSEILDAGCGTGRYAIELARRGYVVHGIDLSADLIEVAMRANGQVHRGVSFAVGDITHLPPSRYPAILYRGVLNDIVDDAVDAVFGLRQGTATNGALILDVREWTASVERKARSRFSESVSRLSVAN